MGPAPDLQAWWRRRAEVWFYENVRCHSAWSGDDMLLMGRFDKPRMPRPRSCLRTRGWVVLALMPLNKLPHDGGSGAKPSQAAGLEGLGAPAWGPNTDVYVADEHLVVNLELAGMSREDLEVTLDQDRIRIRGQRPDPTRRGRCRFLMMEIDYGRFERIVEIPAGFDLSRARAQYQNGFLRIEVPASMPSASTTLPVA